MRYTLLGNSGLRVSEVALGTMTFGTDWGWGAPAGESAKQFELFAEAGGTLIDTANKYTNGTAESILADLLATDRDHFVVGTKYSLNVRDDDLNADGPALAGGCWHAHACGVLAGVQKGSRPMKPSSLVCGSASSGTSTLTPYWPEDRMTSSICSIPASSWAQKPGSSRSSWPVARARSQVCMKTSAV
jgi:hypothetical protein